jgi:hypothetical protein
MATFTVTAQLTTGTLTVGATDRVWFNAAAFGDNVAVSSYQDSTHISNSSDVHQCSSNHVHNTKYVASGTMSLDGAGTANLSTLTTGNAPLKINFSDASSVATSVGKFYAYDGTTDATAMVGVAVQAAEAGTSSAWVAANGSGAALSLADQGAATSHDFYIAISVSPTSAGAKTGKFKLSLTYA